MDATSTAGPLLSIVVPVFNEEDSIDLFLDAIAGPLKEAHVALGPGGRSEIVFVDDGSFDATASKIIARLRERPGLRLVRLSRNFGKDAALAAGLAHAKGDAVVPMDVDLQDPPEILPAMIAAWQRGAKVVNAVRADRSSDTALKRASARLFYKAFNRLSTYPIAADVGDYRLLDRVAVDVLNRLPERIRFMKGLFSWIGFRQETVAYKRPPRAAGTTKWKFWSLWNFALDGITGSTTLPLRLWTYLGGTIALAALLFALFIVGQTLVLGVDTPGYASLIVVTLVMGALNLVALGLLGEYVGRIAIEVRQRPLYVVEEVLEAPEQPS
ncbi:MAG: glycosyltransferase family 2 protein [Pseudomonadota bacterium]